ncbi:MAG TPA: hypothetical protein VGL59_01295 [Polyangia bacterium]|jgi:hypothetical protein
MARVMEGRTLGLGIAVAGLASIAIGTALLYAGGPPPAPPRPKSPTPDQAGAAMKYSATLYRALVEQDARSFGLPAPKPDELARPFPYFNELTAERKLKVGGTVQTPHLRLSLLVRKEAGSMEGQAYSADHLVLRIDNLTGHTLAYRVVTAVPDEERCAAKGVIPQNAIVLEPNQSISRTECFFRADQRIDVKSIEVMEIPRLAGFYLSRLAPGLVLYSARTSAGHAPAKGTLCPQTFSWRDIRDGADRGEFGWRDVIDFYARHSCEEYAFFPAYRFRTTASAPLPARPPGQDL